MGAALRAIHDPHAAERKVELGGEGLDAREDGRVLGKGGEGVEKRGDEVGVCERDLRVSEGERLLSDNQTHMRES